jgi:hypothetical protein
LFYGAHVARGVHREAGVPIRHLAGAACVLLIALPLVNLAHLLPIAGYVGRATLGMGYDELQRIAAELRGAPAPDLTVSRALGVIWPLRFSTAPGLYLGALPLIAMSAGFVSRRTRSIAVTFGVLAVLFFVAGMEDVIAVIAPKISGLPFADFYRHSSGRFMYGALFATVVVAACGVDAWRDARTWRDRALMTAPGFLIWGALPFVAGVIPTRMALFVVGAVAAAGLLWITTKRPQLAWLIPVVLSVELAAGAFGGQIAGYRLARDGLETSTDKWLPFRPLPEPTLSAAGYIGGGPIEDEVAAHDATRDGRLMMMGEGLTWLFRPLLSDIEMPQGYNPVQLERYWRYVRARVDERLRYNMSIFPTDVPSGQTMDLMHIGWIALEKGTPPPPDVDWSQVASDGRRDLYRVDGTDGIPPEASARVSIPRSWDVSQAEEALDAVTSPSFDPVETVVLEREPSVPRPPTGFKVTGTVGRLTHMGSGATGGRVEVALDRPGIVLIRNAYDENWVARVDGEPAEVMVADYFLQAVAVEAGEHTLELAYEEPNVVPGLLGSGISLVVLLAMAAISARRERRVQL